MVKKSKILTAAAALALGVTALSGANGASAYTVVPQNADNVKVCRTMTGIIDPVSTTFTYTVAPDSTEFDMSRVAVTGGTVVTGSTTSGSLVFTMDFNANASTTQPICATLNFVPALKSSATWNGTAFTIKETASSDNQYDTDTAEKTLEIAYTLNVDDQNAPIYNSQTGDYESLLTAKSNQVDFQTAIVTTKTHIELTKKVRGNLAEPNKQFDFSITLNKKNQQSSATNTYHVFTSNGTAVATTPSPCQAGSACTFKLKHNDTVYIGYDGSQNELPVGSYTYTISETNTGNYTVSYARNNGAEATGSTTPSGKNLEEEEKIVFFNEYSDSISGRFFVIFPFILLAIIAAIAIYAVRRSSAKKEQA